MLILLVHLLLLYLLIMLELKLMLIIILIKYLFSINSVINWTKLNPIKYLHIM